MDKKTKNCLLWGCGTAVVVFVLGVVAIYFTARYAFNALIAKYTSATPAPMPEVQISDSEFTNVVNRFNAFRDSLEFQTNSMTLALDANEINALITKDPRFAKMKGTLHVEITDDKIDSTLSLPLDKFNIDSMKGRYLNGKGTLKASIESGQFVLRVDSLEVNGVKVPEPTMVSLRRENLAKNMQNDPKVSDLIQKIDSLEIKDSKVVITTKVSTQPSAPTNAPPPAAVTNR